MQLNQSACCWMWVPSKNVHQQKQDVIATGRQGNLVYGAIISF